MRLGCVQATGGRGAVLGLCHLRCKNQRRACCKPAPGAELLASAYASAYACAYVSYYVSAHACEQAGQRLRTTRFLRETGINRSRPQNPSDESP